MPTYKHTHYKERVTDVGQLPTTGPTFLLGFFSGFFLGDFFLRFAPVTNEVFDDILPARPPCSFQISLPITHPSGLKKVRS